MSVLGEEVASYITSRRRLGFVVRHDEGTLRSFVRFCDNTGLTTVTTTSISNGPPHRPVAKVGGRRNASEWRAGSPNISISPIQAMKFHLND